MLFRSAWPHQLRVYWQNIQSFLDNQIMNLAGPIDILARRDNTEVNLRSVETYWEYGTDDALHAVSMLVPTMQTLGREASIRTYSLAEESMEGNSLSVRIRLTSSITCTFYAKTTKRVRLELKHDLTERAGVIGGSHTSNNPDDLLEWLDILAQDAAQRGNQVLRHLTHELSHNVAQRPVYELLSRIAAVSEDQAINDHLVRSEERRVGKEC